jgi:hypothetical protein
MPKRTAVDPQARALCAELARVTGARQATAGRHACAE